MTRVRRGRGWPSCSCSGAPTLLHPRGARRPRLLLALGAPGANAPLVGSPHCAWKTTPVRPGFKGPTRQLQPLGGAGRRRGWCGSQKKPSHSRPALRRDGQRALKVRDRRRQLTLPGRAAQAEAGLESYTWSQCPFESGHPPGPVLPRLTRVHGAGAVAPSRAHSDLRCR